MSCPINWAPKRYIDNTAIPSLVCLECGKRIMIDYTRTMKEAVDQGMGSMFILMYTALPIYHWDK